MAGGSYRSQVAAGNAPRARRLAARPAADAAASARRASPPRRDTHNARAIGWWRGLSPRARTAFRGVAVCAAAALVFVALLSRQDHTSPLGLAGALSDTLFGWGAYPLFLLLSLLGMIRLGEGVTGRTLLRAGLPVRIFALWCVALAGSCFFLGHDTGGLTAMLLSWPLRALLPPTLAAVFAVLLAGVLVLAILHVTPAQLAHAGRATLHHAGNGIRRGAGAARARLGRGRQRRQGSSQQPADNPANSEVVPVADEEAPLPSAARSLAKGYATPLPPDMASRLPAHLFVDDDEDEEDAESEPEAPKGFVSAQEPPRDWALPSLELLDAPQVLADDGEEQIDELAARLEQVLRSFRVDAEVRREDVSVGPTVIRFGIRPVERARRDDRGRVIVDEDGRPVMVRTRVSRIMNLRSDLALALEAQSLRMEAPVPGQPYVGLEIPRPRTRMVTLREIIVNDEFQRVARRSKLAVSLGRDVSGQARAADLAKFPHVLVAGATGSGKSVCLNAFLCSILSQATPEDVRLLLVDPKKVELTVYNGIPHLLAPVVTEAKAMPELLKRALEEMERRYQLFSELGVRDLEGYRHLARQEPELERLPSIVIVIDELADLMMAAPGEVEYMICRLAQLARATGLHLVVATQRPSVDVITGLIKANIPTRISFMVSSQVDSRTILDMGGAEHLLGRGDLLFLAADANKPERIQGAFVSDEEVSRLVRFWRSQTLLAAVRGQAVTPAVSAIADDEEPPIPPLPARDGAEAARTAQPPADGEDWPVVAGGRERRVRVPFDYEHAEDEDWTDFADETRMPPIADEPDSWLRPPSS
jgi:hypothetical protein